MIDIAVYTIAIRSGSRQFKRILQSSQQFDTCPPITWLKEEDRGRWQERQTAAGVDRIFAKKKPANAGKVEYFDVAFSLSALCAVLHLEIQRRPLAVSVQYLHEQLVLVDLKLLRPILDEREQ